MATNSQIGFIHGLKNRAKLDEEAYRGVLAQYGAGATSSKHLSVEGAIKVIDRLKVLAGEAPSDAPRLRRASAEGALALDGPYVGKLRALWLTAWNLGLTEARSDTALAAFVARQTGIDSPSWVRDAVDARKAIEALKKWIARESGLEWPKDGRDIRALKEALVRRQWRLLIEGGMRERLGERSDLADYAGAMIGRAAGQVVPPVVSMTLADLSLDQFDALASALGAKLRSQRSPAHQEIMARGAAVRDARRARR